MSPAPSSRIPGFHALPMHERVARVAKWARLGADDVAALAGATAGHEESADAGAPWDRMVENCVGTLPVPLGVATNFMIDGRDVLVPMAVEEPSVVAAASNAARIARAAGGFETRQLANRMIGQVFLVHVENPDAAAAAIHRDEPRLLAAAEPDDSALRRAGGGAVAIETRIIDTRLGRVLVVHLLVDTRDAMGANAVNTRVERLAPALEELSGGTARLRILSNLADKCVVSARAVFSAEALGGPDVVEGILEAQWLAEADPYRAATHNKGILNGVDAVVLATGNDWRAVEAGAHAYAARSGVYGPLTAYEADGDGNLVGTLTMPLAVGVVGGATKANPVARVALRILGATDSETLARCAGAVGLAQNLAALRALSTEGIQRGHMRLHRRFAKRT